MKAGIGPSLRGSELVGSKNAGRSVGKVGDYGAYEERPCFVYLATGIRLWFTVYQTVGREKCRFGKPFFATCSVRGQNKYCMPST